MKKSNGDQMFECIGDLRRFIYSTDQLPHGLVVVDSLVKLNSEGKFPIMLSNTSNDPIDTSNQSFPIEAVFEKIETRIKCIEIFRSEPIIWKKKRAFHPVNPTCAILLANVRLKHLSQSDSLFFQFLWDYNDLFFLSEAGDQLQHSVVKTHFEILTKSCRPQTAKIYCIPEIHRKRVKSKWVIY